MQNVTVSQAARCPARATGTVYQDTRRLAMERNRLAVFDLPRTLRIYDVSDFVAFDRIRPGEEFETPDLPGCLAISSIPIPGTGLVLTCGGRDGLRLAPVDGRYKPPHAAADRLPSAIYSQGDARRRGPAVSHRQRRDQRETVATEIACMICAIWSAIWNSPSRRNDEDGKVAGPPRHFAGRDAVSVMIWYSVDPRSWYWACGSMGRSEWLGDRLIAEQTPENHGKIRQVLHDVRLWYCHRRINPAMNIPENRIPVIPAFA